MTTPKTIMIDETEYVRKDSIPCIPKGEFAPFVIGRDYFIQTPTHYFLGTLIMVTDEELVLISASWVADTGRLNKFLDGSSPKENEPYPEGVEVIIGRGALISASERKIVLEVIG